MIQSKQDYKFYLQEDRTRNNMNISALRYIGGVIVSSERYRVWRYLKLLRKCEYYKNCKHGLFNKLIYMLLRANYARLGNKYHLFIPMNKVGYGLRIMHIRGGGGCHLNCEKIGNYCGINAGVLLGVKNDKTPVAGDYVTFGPGCKVIGGITIGNHVLVAPNAVAIHDIPDNCIVAGVPAKVIKVVEGGEYS